MTARLPRTMLGWLLLLSGALAGEVVPESLSREREGVWLFQQDGRGKFFLPAAIFTPNANSGRGGAPAWDVCTGWAFDNGVLMWVLGRGSRIGSFQVTGGFRVRVGSRCGKTAHSPGLDLSGDFGADSGTVQYHRLAYLEAAVDGVELYQLGGAGRLFVPATSFSPNYNSGRRGVSAWDVCTGWAFDNSALTWVGGRGSRVGGFRVLGDWNLLVGKECGKTLPARGLQLSGPYNAASDMVTQTGVAYFEVTQMTPTTTAPSTAAPTTVAPTTAAPTTAAPTTAAPTTAANTTLPSSPVASTTATPAAVAPTTAAPTTAAPTMAESTAASPTAATPTAAAPATTSAPDSSSWGDAGQAAGEAKPAGDAADTSLAAADPIFP